MTSEQETLLRRFAQEVVNSPLHLTSDRDLQLFWVRHVEDALKLLDAIPLDYRKPVLRVLDVGSGNGIPGIPIAVMNPAWSVELLDSDNKKCGFLDMICKKYVINNCHVIVGRAEAHGQSAMRQGYDVVFSRALGKLRVAAELAGSFVKLGGLLIVPHGTSWNSELNEAAFALGTVGLKMISNYVYEIEGVKFHSLIFIKVSDTPKIYPRPIGIPSKKPL